MTTPCVPHLVFPADVSVTCGTAGPDVSAPLLRLGDAAGQVQQTCNAFYGLVSRDRRAVVLCNNILGGCWK